MRLARYLIWLVMIVVGLALVLDVAYFVHGSLEMFPTEEQQEKVRWVAGVLAALLACVEIGLWWLLRQLGAGEGRLQRKGATTSDSW